MQRKEKKKKRKKVSSQKVLETGCFRSVVYPLSMAFSEHQQLQPEDLLRFITQQQGQITQLKEQIELLEA